jgi:hypothetical protein
MPGTRRTPLDRPAVGLRITERAVDIFIAMGKLRCTCPPVPADYWTHKTCASCERWWDLHSELADELGTSVELWEWLIVARQSPKHAGTFAVNEGTVARTVAFQEAAKARRAVLLPQKENGAAGREPHL